ncbi:MAG: HNH endonuclease [Deltaproteobacteria bacterium]|nr:HNH endonuclease [Deltaproteobacteria bacterium]
MAGAARRRWVREEILLALHHYWRIPFGQQHARNPRVIELANALRRTPSSVAMKLNNITSLDPEEAARGVHGLEGASDLDRQVWEEFRSQPDITAPESEELWRTRVERGADPGSMIPGATETTAERKVRLGQEFFRRVVLANFDGRCALTGLALPELVNASHIVGWAKDPRLRLDPTNGIALNRLHDAAFDRCLITFDEDLRLVVGDRARRALRENARAAAFLDIEGQRLAEPRRHPLSQGHLALHRREFERANA